MITRKQLGGLRAGDVVELRDDRHPLIVIRGPLTAVTSTRLDLGVFVFCVGDCGFSLTVIERAPRPLYVNHDRAEPVPGDVVRFEDADHPDDSYTNVFLPRNSGDRKPWLSLTHDPGYRYSDEDARAGHLEGWMTRLLVDGETGMTVSTT